MKLSKNTAALLLLSFNLSSQTVDTPVRAAHDPGVVTTRQQITPAGVPTVFQGRVYGLAFGSDPAELWVLNASHVYRMNWKNNHVVRKFPLNGRPGLQGIAYSGGHGIAVVSDRSGKVRLLSIDEEAVPMVENIGDQIGGAVAVSGSTVLVPLIFNNKLAVVREGKLAGTVQTGIAPFGVATDGQTAFVSNWGGRPPTAADLTAATGYSPIADRVVIDSRGIAATGTVTRIDLNSLQPTASIPAGLHPTALTWDRERQMLYVANSNSDSVSVVETKTNTVVKTIPIQPFRTRVAGIAPTALALSPDGSRLYVACGGINAIVVLNISTGVIEGAIPTAWYPNGLALTADGKWLAVSALLGPGSGWREAPEKRHALMYRGSVSVIPLPDHAQLASYTTAVAENNRMSASASSAPRDPAAKPLPVPERTGDPSLIEHVVYIIKENRTYDQVFGDLSKGNGDPTLVMFGENITPNQHRLADDFVLLDNFYATGGNSADGHQWATQANETAYCLWPGYIGRSYPYDGSDPIAYSSGGFIWDLALQQNKSVQVFGEFAPAMPDPPENRQALLQAWKRGEDFTGRWKINSPIPPLDGLLARHYPSYSTAIPDVVRAQILLADIAKWQAEGKMPNLVLAQLPSNHTNGASPGASTPQAMVADNDLALGQIVEALSKTQFWPKMAIFVVEDDAQNGVDHVDGHRTVALAISPYTRRGHVDSTFYSHQSILKTIELILGLPTLSLFDLIANDMRNSFTGEADLKPFEATVPKQSLEERNPPLSALRGAPRRAALASMRMRWNVPDAVPTERLNRIVWQQVRGWGTPYPEPRRAVFAPLTIEIDDDDR